MPIVATDKFAVDLLMDGVPFDDRFDNDHLGTQMPTVAPSTPSP
jgi:hypothetical protein